jgi:hypothetical protein
MLLPTLLRPLLSTHRILLVTSRQAAISANNNKRSSTDYVREIIKQRDVVLFSEIDLDNYLQQNSWNVVQKGKDLARRTGRSMIICVGNDMAIMDVGKAIAITTGLDDSVITIPTLPCGGSESSKITTIVNWDEEDIVPLPNLKSNPILISGSGTGVMKELIELDKPSQEIQQQAFLTTWIRKVLVMPSSTVMLEGSTQNQLNEILTYSSDIRLHEQYQKTLHGSFVDGITSILPLPRSSVSMELVKPILDFLVSHPKGYHNKLLLPGISSNQQQQQLYQYYSQLISSNLFYPYKGIKSYLKSQTNGMEDLDDETIYLFCSRAASLYLLRNNIDNHVLGNGHKVNKEFLDDLRWVFK